MRPISELCRVYKQVEKTVEILRKVITFLSMIGIIVGIGGAITYILADKKGLLLLSLINIIVVVVLTVIWSELTNKRYALVIEMLVEHGDEIVVNRKENVKNEI